MKQLNLDIHREIIVDNFAGGGGASTGIERALGRRVDVAINHNPEAIAMHTANHPETRHYCESVWDVDPRDVEPGRPIGLLWLSPDCKHFSKAKGGKPVEKKIRGLAWVALRWAAIRKPRVIVLENVEEFVTWGPLVESPDGKLRPCPKRKGREFNAFRNALQRQGYQVEHRELRACDYGAPTIRRRLFLIARRDGLPIVWPVPTHGNPKSESVKSGQLKPWRTAAECIDWSIPCPSIFLTKEEGRAIGVKRPLAEATLRRIAKGIMRYVVEAADPFIVPLTHHGADRVYGMSDPFRTITAAHRGELALATPFISTYYGDKKPNDVRGIALDEPLPTQTTENRHALVAPIIIEHANGSNPRSWTANEPLRTQCAQVKGGHFALVAPHITKFRANSIGSGCNEPMHTVTAGGESIRPAGAAHAMGLVSATLVQIGYGERKGQSPRVPGLDKPLGTVVAGGAKHALVSAFLAKHYSGVVGSDLHDPIGTVTGVDHHSFVAANLVHMGHGEQSSTGAKRWSHGVRSVEVPLNTVTASGVSAGLVASNLIKLRGDNVGQSVDEPLRTISAGGTHFAEVRAFLVKYYGTDQDPQLQEPLHTVTTKDRYGLVMVDGEEYRIDDVGLRMLGPRELFRAQGFPENYIIGDDPTQGLKLTKSAQVRMCGNSVCPPLAAALVAANVPEMAITRKNAA